MGVCTPAYSGSQPAVLTHNYILTVSQPTPALKLDMNKYTAKDTACTGRVVGHGTKVYAAVPATAPAMPDCLQDPIHPTLYYQNKAGSAPYKAH